MRRESNLQRERAAEAALQTSVVSGVGGEEWPRGCERGASALAERLRAVRAFFAGAL